MHRCAKTGMRIDVCYNTGVVLFSLKFKPWLEFCQVKLSSRKSVVDVWSLGSSIEPAEVTI